MIAGSFYARLAVAGRAAASAILVAGVLWILWRQSAPTSADQWRWLLTSHNGGPSLALFLVVIASVGVRALRWATILRGTAGGRWRLCVGFAWCFLVLQTLPFRTGEAYRVVWIKLRGGSAVEAAAAVVLERILDTASVCIVLAIALLAEPLYLSLIGRGSVVLLVVAATAVAALALIAPAVLRALEARAGRIAKWIARGREKLVATLTGPQRVTVFLLTIGNWAIVAAGFAYYLEATVGASWPTALAVLALVNLSGVLVLAPANIGVFEAVAVSVLALSGIAADVALIASIGLHLAIILGQAVAGLVGRLILLIVERQ